MILQTKVHSQVIYSKEKWGKGLFDANIVKSEKKSVFYEEIAIWQYLVFSIGIMLSSECCPPLPHLYPCIPPLNMHTHIAST